VVCAGEPWVLGSGRVITGSLVWFLCVCERGVWFMGRGISPDQDSEALGLGRVVHGGFRVGRRGLGLRGVSFDGVRGDTVYEVKSSSRNLGAARMQLAYYLYRLRMAGVEARGVILVPGESVRFEVALTEDLVRELLDSLGRIRVIVEGELPPPPRRVGFCGRCAYGDLCWA